MANKGKAAGKKVTAAGKPSDSRANPAKVGLESGGTGTNVSEPGFLNWDII